MARLSPTKARERFETLRAQYLQADAQVDEIDMALSSRYGGSYQRNWLSRSDQNRLEKARAKRDKIGDKLFALIMEISPRDWEHGVPSHWIRSSLSYEDAVRPASQPLSVVPPTAYGYTTPIKNPAGLMLNLRNPLRRWLRA